MGSSAGASTTRATRSASTRNAPPISSDSGSTRAWEPPTNRRAMCGTTRPTKPIRPLTATADGGGHRGGEDDQQPQPAGVHAQRAGLVVADGEHVERPAAEQQHDARTGRGRAGPARRRTTGRGRAGRAASRRPRAGRRCSAAAPGSAPAARKAATATPASSRVGLCEPPAAVPRAQRAADADQRADEGGQRHDAERPEGLRRGVGDDQRRAEPGAGGRAEQVRVGQRVAEDALVGGAGDRQPGADQGGEHHPRQPQLQQHGLLGAAQPAGQVDAERAAGRAG